MYVQFTPSTTGPETATLNFNDNAPGSPHTVLLTGFGQTLTTTLAATTPTLTFAGRSVNTTSDQQAASVLNTCTGIVSFTGYTIAGANPVYFAISSNQCQSSYTGNLPEATTCYV